MAEEELLLASGSDLERERQSASDTSGHGYHGAIATHVSRGVNKKRWTKAMDDLKCIRC